MSARLGASSTWGKLPAASRPFSADPRAAIPVSVRRSAPADLHSPDAPQLLEWWNLLAAAWQRRLSNPSRNPVTGNAVHKRAGAWSQFLLHWQILTAEA